MQFPRVFPAQWVHKCLEVKTNVSNINQLTFAFMLLTVFWRQENEKNIMFFSCATKCKCFYCLRLYGHATKFNKNSSFVVLSVSKHFTQNCRKCEPCGCSGKLKGLDPRMLKQLYQFKGSSERLEIENKCSKSNL